MKERGINRKEIHSTSAIACVRYGGKTGIASSALGMTKKKVVYALTGIGKSAIIKVWKILPRKN